MNHENVTIRRFNRTKSASEMDLNEKELFVNSTLLDNTLSNSLPNISLCDKSQLLELKKQTDELKTDLESANDEIAKLVREVFDLKRENESYKKNIEIYKKVTSTDLLKDNSTKTPRRSSMPFPFKLAYRTISKPTPVSFTRGLHKQYSPSVCQELERSFTELVKDPAEILNMKSQQHSIESMSQQPITRDNVTSRTAPSKCKRRIVIIADQQGRYLRSILQELIGEEYLVTCYSKPGASIGDVVKSGRQEIATLTEKDYVILLGGTNDSHPYKFQFDLHCWINTTKKTNVIICNIPYNRNLNRWKLNYELKFICSQHSHLSLIDLNYSNYRHTPRVLNTQLCRMILKETLRIDYKIKSSNYSNKQSNYTEQSNLVNQYTQTETLKNDNIHEENKEPLNKDSSRNEIHMDTKEENNIGNRELFRL